MTTVEFLAKMDYEGGLEAMAQYGGGDAASGLPFEREWRAFCVALTNIERAIAACELGEV